MTRVFLGLGSNLENPVQQIKTAITELDGILKTRVVRVSSLYQTPPVGKENQPDFINAVAEIKTFLDPESLLVNLLAIEKQHHRIRLEKNGPRTLDIDVLLYGNSIIDCPNLQVPHPRLMEREFVLVPLSEIAPDLVFPCGTRIKNCLSSLHSQSFTIVN